MTPAFLFGLRATEAVAPTKEPLLFIRNFAFKQSVNGLLQSIFHLILVAKVDATSRFRLRFFASSE
jgi:hypothetical protein